MNLEGIMLSEISQAEKYKYCVNFLMRGIKQTKHLTNRTEHKQTYRYREETSGCQRGGEWHENVKR